MSTMQSTPVMIFEEVKMKKYTIMRRIHRDPSPFLKSNPLLEILKYVAVIVGSYALSKLEEFINKNGGTTEKKQEE